MDFIITPKLQLSALLGRTKESRGESHKWRGCNRNASLNSSPARLDSRPLGFAWLASFGSLANTFNELPFELSDALYGTFPIRYLSFHTLHSGMQLQHRRLARVFPTFLCRVYIHFSLFCFLIVVHLVPRSTLPALHVCTLPARYRFHYHQKYIINTHTSRHHQQYHVQLQLLKYGFAAPTQRVPNAAIRERTRLARDLRRPL